ncbi:MAG: hemolysin III family protein [Coriobacteriales bacterium]|jgi:hemolysin III|nr:hemolysin III family protein [Coriobacteriales bacterium]
MNRRATTGRQARNEASKQRRAEPREGRIKRIRDYSIGEEIANSVTHGIGALLGIAALVLMAVFAVMHGGGVRLAAALVFGIALIVEYTASTLYHALTAERAKKVFKVLDHASIYLLIAGTYAPFCLVSLADDGGAVLCAIEWALAVIGIAVEAFWVFRPRWVSVLVYLAMGWLIVLRIGALVAAVPFGGVALLLAGGVCYTVGTVFYLLKKVPYMHSIWHVWVLAGSVCHVLGVLLFVL